LDSLGVIFCSQKKLQRSPRETDTSHGLLLCYQLMRV
jgi:hypothetical protein